MGMKKYYKIIALVLLSHSFITGARAQLKAGTEGIYIKAGSMFSSDGLGLKPSADLTLIDLSLEKSATPVTGDAGSGISRGYKFSVPLTFTGSLGFSYFTAELNSNTESLLQLFYKSTEADVTYTVTTGTSINTVDKYLENTFTSTTFSTLSAADPVIFVPPASAPITTTAAATVITITEATLNGTVNANSANTTITFAYGTDESVVSAGGGTIIAATPGTASGISNTIVSAALTGLSASTTYYYKVNGSNSVGDNSGLVLSFTTKAAPSTNANLSALSLSEGTLSPVFVSGTTSYSATVGNSITLVTVTAALEEANATIMVNGATATSGSISGAIALNVGSNTLTTLVTAQDGTTTKTYTVSIIRLAAQTITFNAPSATIYGDADITLPATASSGLTISYISDNTLVATISGNTVTIKSAGTAKITASQAGDADYDAASLVEQNLIVSKKPVTITADAKTKIYGDADPALTYAVTTGSLVGSDAFTGALTRTPGETINTYAITQGTVALSSNYALTYEAVNLAITPKALTIVANNRSKTYGDALTFTVTEFTTIGLINGNTVTGVSLTSTGAITTATVTTGPYPIVPAAATGTGLENYAITYVNGALSVDKKALSVVNTNRSKAYGEVLTNLDFIGSITGLVNNDNISLTRNSTGATANATAGTNYPIVATLTDPDSKLANYTLTNADGLLTVAQKVLTIIANNQSKTYGDAVTFTGTEFTTIGLINGNAVTGVNLTSTGAITTATVTVGPYPIVPAAATGTGLENYAITYVNGVLSVDKKALSVVNTNRSKAYGEVLTNLDFIGSITGLVNNDNISLTRNSTGATANATAGANYPIVATLTDPDSKLANYTLTNADGLLTVDQKVLTIIANNRSKTYGDAVAFTGTEFTTIGLINGNAVTGVNLTSTGAITTATVIAGPYPIVPAAATGTGLENYAITYVNGVLNVDKKALSVVNTNRSKAYGEVLTNLDFIGSITGQVNNDNISLTRNSTGATANATAGTNYPIVATLTDPDSKLANYTLTNADGLLTVAQKVLTIIANNQSKTYGDAVTFTGTEFIPVGLVNGNTVTGVTLTSGGAAATASVTGAAYSITPAAATGIGLDNYAITYTNGVLSIGKKALVVIAEDKEKFSGRDNPILTARYTGFANGEDNSSLSVQPVLSTTATTNSPIGDYAITVSGAAAANYSITYAPGVLKIKPAAPNVITLAAIPLFENQSAGANAGTFSSVSEDPMDTFTFSLVAGTGDTDNGLFAISGNKISTVASLDFENKSNYNIRVRSNSVYGLWLEKELSIILNDVNEVPTLAAIASQAICYATTTQVLPLTGISAGPETNQSTTLSVSSNSSLFENLNVSGNGATGNLTYRIKEGVGSGTATITVTVKDSGGTANGGTDTFSRSFVITVNPLPVASISSDKGTQMSKGEVAVLSATGGSSYVWANASGIISGHNTAVLTVRPSQTTTYTLTVSNVSGCTQVQQFTITILDDYAKVKALNILSPNGDGYNDKWLIDNLDYYPNNEVKIFDRSGRQIYSKKSYDNSWDGMLNGAVLEEGTYFYVIDFGNGSPKLKGFITIVR
ncbi:T9SS type B sorting domain-containing protein [Pedobacter hiemivivus]|uniref:T9SS type B sorting domain-containing protein n=2 Tax=Pedobacter hiemivivus TaxID=2530454 RepID=A0A4U1GQ18_9SPHI|nr:T9SS type B sorting domain-containing protein [Pedobacter hiemivivus]